MKKIVMHHIVDLKKRKPTVDDYGDFDHTREEADARAKRPPARLPTKPPAQRSSRPGILRKVITSAHVRSK